MGCGSSTAAKKQGPGRLAAWAKSTTGFGAIPDQYSTFEEVSTALRKAGLESSQLVVGVDFTKSNTWTGKQSFQNRCLHSLQTGSNPYFEVLSSVAKVLRDFDDDNMIPAYGFGDARTKNRNVFSFNPNDEPCDGLEGCLARYTALASTTDLAGPTNFAPLIRQAIQLVRRTGEYHILLMVADGQVDQVQETTAAIVEASNYPLSIVMVGVGDGPWELMETFDDELPERKFDNFQFVDYTDICRKYPREKRDTAFAVHALMEVPDQYRAVKQLGLLLQDEDGPCSGRRTGGSNHKYYRPPQVPLPPPPRSLGICQQQQSTPSTLLNAKSLASGDGALPFLKEEMKGLHHHHHHPQAEQYAASLHANHHYHRQMSVGGAYEPEQEMS